MKNWEPKLKDAGREFDQVMKNHGELVAREGWIFILFFAALTIGLYFFEAYVYALIGSILTVFCVFFFRNPPRTIDGIKGVVVSPADGRVMDVVKVKETKYLQGPAVRVRIFLSIFDVHVNRVPIAGRVEFCEKVPGLYLAAYKDEAGQKNARNYLGINSEWGKILVVQVTGLIARRLVCWVKPGDLLQTGERFGLIRFGSCTEIYLPKNATILVQPGQKVKGGESQIARLCK